MYQGAPQNYGRLLQSDRYTHVVRSITKYLNKWGVTNIINDREPVSKAELIYANPTIYILPLMQDVMTKDKNAIAKNMSAITLTIDKHKLIVYPEYEIFDVIYENILYENIIIATYYPNRNLIILYFNPFTTNIQPKVREIQKNFNLIKIQKPIFNKIDNSAILIHANLIKNSKLFIINLQKEYKKLLLEIENTEYDIESLGRKIITSHQTIRIKKESIYMIQNMMNNFQTEFTKNISEIKNLEFIKDVIIDKTGIIFDYGDINILYNKTTYFIGHMQAIISPTTIRFQNLNGRVDSHLHPHIHKDGHACEGSFSVDFANLLGKLDFKRLAFLILQFLKTYNHKSPLLQIAAWKSNQ